MKGELKDKEKEGGRRKRNGTRKREEKGNHVQR